MHICLCSDEFPPETAWGGIATYVAEVALALQEIGHKVTVISLSLSGRDYVNHFGEIPVIRLAVPSIAIHNDVVRSIVFPIRCAQYLRLMRRKNHSPDIVEYPDWLGQGILRSGLPSVIRLHASAGVLLRKGDLAQTLHHKTIARLESIALRRPAALLANSQLSARETRAAFNIPADRPIGVIPCLINTELFKPAAKPIGAPVLLFVGRLDRAKGAPTLFAALKILVDRFQNLKCFVVGSGFGDDDESRKRFKERTQWLAHDPSVAASVKFMGQLPREELPLLYQSASVVVIPSLFESFGYVALEAMSCGRPTVISSQCGISEWVENNVSASIVNPEDENALAESVTKLLCQPDLSEAMGQKARQFVLEQCSRQSVAQKLTDYYTAVIQEMKRK